MSFSRVYEDAEEAERHRAKLLFCNDIIAPFKAVWGPNSMLYQLDHEFYNNDRPPHVAGGHEREVTVYLSKAYVKEIK